MDKPDMHVSMFSEGETGRASFDVKKYDSVPWGIKDYDQAIALLQYGLQQMYRQKHRLIEEENKLRSEIESITE